MLQAVILILLTGGGCLIILCSIELYRKNIFLWLPAYVRGVLRKREKHDSPLHVMFCFVDHYEPGWQRPDLEIERARVARWCREYPSLAEGHQDADGQIPKHCFFYPEEEYREEHLPGSVNIPLRRIDADARKRLDPARAVIVYCWDDP